MLNFRVVLGSLVALIALSGGVLQACGRSDPPSETVAASSPVLAPQSRAVMAAGATVVDPLVLATGISGTYTVPRGYVVSISAVAANGLPEAGIDAGGYGTITITPNGPSITDGSAVTQPPIPIPAGYAYSVSRPVIQGSSIELGTGSVIVFSNTVAYTITMSLGGT